MCYLLIHVYYKTCTAKEGGGQCWNSAVAKLVFLDFLAKNTWFLTCDCCHLHFHSKTLKCLHCFVLQVLAPLVGGGGNLKRSMFY